MTEEYMQDLIAYPDASRVWIYQSNKPFGDDEVDRVNAYIERFAREWTSHNLQLKATGGLMHRHFIVLVVDETRAGASGCSIDKSVRFIQFLEQEFGQNLFDRLTFAYLQDKEVRLIRQADLKEAYEKGEITDQTLFFNNLVKTKKEYLDGWLVPLGESWHKRMI